MSIRTKLRALKFPSASTFDVADKEQVKALVVWLEDRKIRQLPAGERGPLRTFDANWNKEFIKYQESLELSETAGIDASADDLESVLDEMLCIAVSLEYEDSADSYRSIVPKRSTEGGGEASVGGGGGAKKEMVVDDKSEEFLAAVEELATLLNVPPHSDPAMRLQASVNILRQLTATSSAAADKSQTQQQQAPPAQQQQQQQGGGGAGKKGKGGGGGAAAAAGGGGAQGVDALLQDFPLGFDTGDAAINRAAALLRLLYVRDLREVQSTINDAMVALQEYTANPKTDAKLGKVGV